MRVYLALIIFMLLIVPAFGKTLYVDSSNEAGPWLGTKTSPYRFIYQDTTPGVFGGIIAAAPGDLILVRPGTYIENIDFRGKAISIRSDVDFDEATFDLDPVNTIIDGNQSGSVAYFENGETETAVLQGFTLTNGSGTPMGSYRYGGGVFCLSSSPKLMHNIIRHNQDIDMGGGIFCYYNANPVILNCAIFRNSATGTHHGTGGGIACWFLSNPIIVNCSFLNNEASVQGGNMWCFNGCDIEIWNTIFANSSAPVGPEIYVGSPTYPSNVFIRNSLIEEDGYFYQAPCGWDAANVESDDPGLLNSRLNEFDFRLNTDSLNPGCINGGDNEAPYVDELVYDLNGDTYNGLRIIEGISKPDLGALNGEYIIDMGCDEFRPLFVPLWFDSITEALDSTITGDIVAVYEGTYYENINFRGNNAGIRSTSEIDDFSAEWSAEKTVLDGSQIGPVIQFVTEEKKNARVLGFTIRNGYADYGGGIYCFEASPTIQGNIIIDNEAVVNGGGICVEGKSKPDLGGKRTGTNPEGNIIKNNVAGEAGGGLIFMNDTDDSDVAGNEISNNTAGLYGGGVAGLNSEGSLEDNYIFENVAPVGAGIYVDDIDEGGLTIQDNKIYHNPTPDLGIQPADAGGGIYFKGDSKSEAKIYANVIFENSALEGGGLVVDGSNPRLQDNIFYNNWAEVGGGALCLSTELGIYHNNFYNNQATVSGGGTYWDSLNTPVLANSILWGNTAPESPHIHYTAATPEPSVLYCTVENGKTYTWFDKYNSIFDDPDWKDISDPWSEDFLRLEVTSPCINIADNSSTTVSDIDGTKHNVAGTADIGCHESPSDKSLLLYTDRTAAKYIMYVSGASDNDIKFKLKAGADFAGHYYMLLGSLSWTTPGIVLQPSEERLPLNKDDFFYLVRQFALIPNPILQDFSGVLDGDGKSEAVFDYGGYLPLELVGYVMSFAYTTAGPGAKFGMTSNPVNFKILESP